MKNNGFSLIEVLVFVSILTLFFVAAIAVTTASIRNSQINQRKLVASHYAEELSSWIASQKEADWDIFVAQSNDTPYCFPSISGNWPTAAACATGDKIDSLYTREAVVGGDVTQMNAQVTVSWSDTGGNYNVQVNKVYRLWE